MLGKSVLLYTSDRASARRLAGFLRASRCEVVRPSTMEAALDRVRRATVDLVLVDYCAGSETVELIAACGELPCIVMASTDDQRVLFDLVCEHGVSNVLCAGGDGGAIRHLDARQIMTTVEKILSGDVFGLDKYTGEFGAAVGAIQVTDAGMRDEVVATLRDHARWLGCGRELANRIGTVADELITNAVYNAPRDEHGNSRYASTDRRRKIVLDPWEYVQVQFASNGEVLALSVTDWFGGLSVDTIRAALARCLSSDDQIEQKDGGAGLGFYTALRLSNQLVVNLEQAECTEIIAVFELGPRMRGDKSAGQSLHLFHSDASRLARGSSAHNPVVASPASIEGALHSFVNRTEASCAPTADDSQRQVSGLWDFPKLTLETADGGRA